MLFTSPYHALRFPEHVSVPEFVLRHTSDEADDKPLLYLSPHTDRTEAKSISLGEIRTQSRAFATALLSQSKGPWKKGDVVFFYSENQHDYLLVVLGVMLAGGIPALVNPQCRGDELKNALNLVSPKILIASKATLPKAKDSVREWQRTVGRKVDVYVFDETHEQSYHHLVHLGRELEHQGNRMVDDVHINPVHDPAMYCFSSGTSGRPKAVVLSHHNLVANTIQMTVALGGRVNKPLFDEGWYDQPHAPLQVGKDQFHYSILPQFHCYGMITSLINLHTATPSVIMPRFYPEQFFEVVQKFRVTFAFVVPPILLALAQSHLVNKYDISSIRSFASGAAYLSKELCKMVHEMHGIQVTDGYGLTEFSPIVSLQTEKDLETKQLNVGRLVPNTEAKVMCLETKQPLSAGERGELWVRGPQMMLGYLHNDEANASAFDPNPTDPERFFKTGDIASIDEQGACCSLYD